MPTVRENFLPFAIAAALAALMLGALAPANAQRSTPVTVQNGPGSPVPVEEAIEKIPVTCRATVNRFSETAPARCQRADTRALIISVPAGYRLAIHHIDVASVGGLGVTGRYLLFVGPSTPTLTTPLYRIIGDAQAETSRTSPAPLIVFNAGETPQHTFQISTGTVNSIQPAMSGFLIREEDFANAY